MFLKDFQEKVQKLLNELIWLRNGQKVSKADQIRQETLKKLSFQKDGMYVREKGTERHKNKAMVQYEIMKDLKIIQAGNAKVSSVRIQIQAL